MKLATFFEKFDQFADTPDAVATLRELILLLSVRGKLSEQSASETCESQLAAARAFAERKGKSFESEPTEVPFLIPENWGWVAVGHSMNLVNGTAFKPEDWTPDGTPIVRIQNLNNEDAPFNRYNGEIEPKFYIRSGDFLISWSGTPGTSFGAFIEISRGGSPRPAGDPRFFGGPIPWITVGEVTKDTGKYLTQTATGLTEEGSERSRFINPGDLLLTNSGATLGVPKISKIRGCMNDGVAVLRLFHSFDLNDFGYLYLTHQTTAFRNVNQGMGQPNLNTPIIAGWFFPLPPLAEQRRIVAKVEQLMALVDALETQLAASRATAANLLSALVAELTTA